MGARDALRLQLLVTCLNYNLTLGVLYLVTQPRPSTSPQRAETRYRHAQHPGCTPQARLASYPAWPNVTQLPEVPPHAPARALLQPHVLQELVNFQPQRLLGEPSPASFPVSWASPTPPQRRVHRSGTEAQEARIGLAFQARRAATATASRRHLGKGSIRSPAPQSPFLACARRSPAPSRDLLPVTAIWVK